MTWIDYWKKDELWSRSRLWRINAALFVRRAKAVVSYDETDSVLDIGSGPGYIEESLAPHVKSICSADVSEKFLESLKENCTRFPNVSTRLLREDYTDLSVCGTKFSLFLCVSVVQYYNDISEVEKLIRSARKIALPGSRMLISDLPLKRNFFGFAWDCLCSFCLSIKEGYAAALLSTAFKRWFGSSDYKSFSQKNRTLYFSIRGIRDLMKRMDLDATIIRKNLSIYANRPALLIRFR